MHTRCGYWRQRFNLQCCKHIDKNIAYYYYMLSAFICFLDVCFSGYDVEKRSSLKVEQNVNTLRERQVVVCVRFESGKGETIRRQQKRCSPETGKWQRGVPTSHISVGSIGHRYFVSVWIGAGLSEHPPLKGGVPA